MEWVKLLTQKLRNQSLSEVSPETANMSDQPSAMEDHDSGTESDEENAEICSITEGLECNNEENQPLSISPIPPPPPPPPTRSSASPSHAIRRPFRQVHPYNQLTDKHSSDTYCITNKTTFMECSDFESCSLDTDTNSSSEFEHHSSEEELTVINYVNVQPAPEKRKWSQVISVEGKNSQTELGSSAGSPASSDEEVKDVLFHSKPSNFSSSPPRGVQRLRRTVSPRLFLANVSPTNSRSCWISPRKRQRQSSIGDSEATVMQRPCLDLEKMQKLSTSRRHHPHHPHHSHHGVSRARIVKIKTFNGSGRPAKCILDPAVFSFRSISTTYNQLTPVEEPCAF